MRTECERQELTGSRLLGMAEVAGIPGEPKNLQKWNRAGGEGLESPALFMDYGSTDVTLHLRKKFHH